MVAGYNRHNLIKNNMSYSIEFKGQFDLTPALTQDQVKYLTKFSRTRRVKRDSQIAEILPDPIRESVGLPIGHDGEFFVGGLDEYDCLSIIDTDLPPSTQPNLRCLWVPLKDGSAITWNGDEKFYGYWRWMQYIIDHFLKPWGITANGCIGLEGEDGADMGKITIKDNIIAK